MRVTFSHDAKPPIDESLDTLGAAAHVANKPLRFRLQPDLYDYGRSAYTTWSGLVWTGELIDVAEGRLLRRGLTAFFKVFASEAKLQAKVVTVLEKLAAEVR